MSTLKDAVEALQGKLAGVSGIRSAPLYAPDSIGEYPIVISAPNAGEIVFEAEKGRLSLHELVTWVLVAQVGTEYSLEAVIPFADSIPAKVGEDITLGGVISTIGSVVYTFGEVQVGQVKYIGFTFRWRGVKIRNAG